MGLSLSVLQKWNKLAAHQNFWIQGAFHVCAGAVGACLSCAYQETLCASLDAAAHLKWVPDWLFP